MSTQLNYRFTYILTVKLFAIGKVVLTSYDVRQENCASWLGSWENYWKTNINITICTSVIWPPIQDAYAKICFISKWKQKRHSNIKYSNVYKWRTCDICMFGRDKNLIWIPIQVITYHSKSHFCSLTNTNMTMSINNNRMISNIS